MNEISTDFSIRAVTIYPDSCRISRFGKINFKKGSSGLTVNNLPHTLTEDTIRVELAKNSRIKIEDIYSEERQVENIDDNRYSEIKKEFDSLTLIKNSLESEYRNLSNEVNLFIHKTKFKDYFNENIKPVINSKSWDGFLLLFKNRIIQNREKTREIIFKLIDIEEKIKSSASMLNRFASLDKKKERFITIILNAEIDAEEEVVIHYIQNNAGWYPSYTLRADLNGGNIELSMFAMIKQLTGEDWKNIEISLSTANPLSNCSIPDIRSKIIKEKSSEILEVPLGAVCLPEMDMLSDVVDGAIDYDEEEISVKSESGKLMKRAILPSISKDKADFYEKKKMADALISQTMTMAGGTTTPSSTITKVYDQKPIQSQKNVSEEETKNYFQETFSISNLPAGYKEYYNYNYTDFIPETRIDTKPQIRVNNHFLNGTPPNLSLGGYDYRYKVASLTNEIPSINIPVQIGIDIRNLGLNIIYTATPIEKENVYLKGRFVNNGASPFPAGPAQIFVDNQFLGNIILPTLALNQSTDISLGIDRDIKVLRKEKSERRTSGMFIGTDVVTDYTIEIELQSFKDKPVKIEIIDRIPVSIKEKEIYIIDEKFDIKPVKITKRKIVVWNIEIPPKEKIVIKFGYSIKHSENYRLTMTKSSSPYYESEE